MSQHNHNHRHESRNNLRVAFFLNLAFTLVELIGGVWTNSVAILSDALHDLGDSLSLAMTWYLQKYSEKKSDQKFSFGYQRFSLLGSLINCLILIVGSLMILAEAVSRLSTPEPPHAPGMLALSILGIAVNGAAVLRLRRGRSLNERVASWHLLEDVLGWFAVLVVSIVLLFRNIPVLDPILSVMITIWVLYNVMISLKTTFFLFLQGVPEEISIDEVEKRIRVLDKVADVHHTHIWSLDGERNVLSVHIVVSDDACRTEISGIKRAVRKIGRELGVDHMTVEIECGENDCSQEIEGLTDIGR